MLTKPITFKGGNDDPAEGMAAILSMKAAESHSLPAVRRIPSEGDIGPAGRDPTLRLVGRRSGR
jgi:hypothetical protein